MAVSEPTSARVRPALRSAPIRWGKCHLWCLAPGQRICGRWRALVRRARRLAVGPAAGIRYYPLSRLLEKGHCPGHCPERNAPVFCPLSGLPPEMQGFGGSTYRPSYRHPGVATCSLGNPGPILGSAATGTARSAVGGSFQTFLAEHRARATGVSL